MAIAADPTELEQPANLPDITSLEEDRLAESSTAANSAMP
jgi:hypothetical protein